jgi:hypothetical protein
MYFNPVRSQAQAPSVIGQWDFNSGNLNSSVGLDPLSYIDGPGGTTEQGTSFGTTTALGIPNIGSTAANVMKFPACTAPQGYLAFFIPVANGGGGLLNQYTLIFDLLYPTASASSIRPLAETDSRQLAPDHDLGINAAGGIGGDGAFSGQVPANTWVRVGFVVDTAANVIRKYIDGVEVGTQSATSGATLPVDGRWALNGVNGVELFVDDNAQAAIGYVNSIQLRDGVLSPGQMRALGAASAAGIPEVIPPVPAFVEKWIPRTELASRKTDIGAVISLGDNTIEDSSVSLRMNGTLQTGLDISNDGTTMTVRKTLAAPFDVGVDVTLQLSYTGSIDGAKTQSRTFRTVLLYEDFNDLALGPNVEEGLAGEHVWTDQPPVDWTIDDSGVPGAGDPGTDGKTEWSGMEFC